MKTNLKPRAKSILSVLTPITLTLVFPSMLRAQLVPIALTSASFNQDLVAEAGSNPVTKTTAALDGASGNNILYSQSFELLNILTLTSGGLPNNGTITSGINSWQLASYSSNNAAFFGPQSSTSSQTIYLSTTGQYSKVSLLDAAGYGPTSVTITLNFSNGTSTNYGTFSILDWFDQTPYVISSLGRIQRSSTLGDNNAPATDPRLYETDITLNGTDQEKTLKSITIKDNSTNNSSTAAFFALSGIATSTLALSELSLSGQYEQTSNAVSLSWDVNDAEGVDRFEVDRSQDGVHFSSVGTVDASTSVVAYSYSDNTVVEGQPYFYRISASLAGGQVIYSNIIEPTMPVATAYSITEAAGTVYVTNSQYTLETHYGVYNLSGQLLLGGEAPSASRFSIDAQALPHGIYVVRLVNPRQSQSMEFLR
jgi:hypothetical protein